MDVSTFLNTSGDHGGEGDPMEMKFIGLIVILVITQDLKEVVAIITRR